MREILFKGKRIDNGEWVYGDLYRDRNFRGDITEIYIIRFDDEIKRFYKEKIIPTTIGQYTGLKDKNGTKIFKGDILAVKFYHRYVERLSWQGDPDAIAEIIYDFSGFRLKCKGKEDTRYADLEDFLTQRQFEEDLVDVCLKETEVIGNIHESEVQND